MPLRNMRSRYMYGGQTSAYATAATVSTVLPKVKSFEPINENNLIYDYGLGEGAYPTTPLLGQYTSGGTVNYDVVDFDFLKHWIGPRSGSGTVGSPFVLTEDDVVSLSTSDIQPFTFEDANNTESTLTVDTYVGCVGNAFTLSADLGYVLRCRATFVARNPITSATATSYTASTVTPFTMVNGAVKWGGTPTAISGVQSFSITHTNNLTVETSRDITSRFLTMPLVGTKVYTFTVTVLMSFTLASSVIDEFYAKANQPEDGATTVSPTAGVELNIELVNSSRNAVIWLDECSINSISKPKSVGNGLVLLTFSGTSRGGKSAQPLRWWS